MKQSRLREIICFALALSILLSACAKAPDPPPDWQAQYDLGIRYLSEGNYQEAVVAFAAAIEIDPKRADAYLGLADAYVALDDEGSAADALRKGYDATGDGRLWDRLDELNGDDNGSDIETSDRPDARPTAGQIALLDQISALLEARDWVAASDFLIENCDALMEYYNGVCGGRPYLCTGGIAKGRLDGTGLAFIYIERDPYQNDTPFIGLYYGDISGGKPEGKGVHLDVRLWEEYGGNLGGRRYFIVDGQWSSGKVNGQAVSDMYYYKDETTVENYRRVTAGTFRDSLEHGEMTRNEYFKNRVYTTATFHYTASRGYPVPDDRWEAPMEDGGRILFSEEHSAANPNDGRPVLSDSQIPELMIIDLSWR
jgi:hypothetical protein